MNGPGTSASPTVRDENGSEEAESKEAESEEEESDEDEMAAGIAGVRVE